MRKTVISILLAALLLVALLILTGCGNKSNGIVGQWKYDGADYTYTFNEDGTGNYNAYGTKMEFTYELKDDQISILYTGNTDPFETKYSIDGDTLNIVDSLGKDTLYKKVK